MERKRRLIALHLQGAPREVREGIEAAMAGERLTPAQGLALYRHAPPPLLSLAASYTRLRLNGLSTYYNRNGHIEPTNLCRYQCSFCSFRKERGHPEAWELTLEQIASKARRLQEEGNTEVHITGGVHPEWTFQGLLCGRAGAASTGGEPFASRGVGPVAIGWAGFYSGWRC